MLFTQMFAVLRIKHLNKNKTLPRFYTVLAKNNTTININFLDKDTTVIDLPVHIYSYIKQVNESYKIKFSCIKPELNKQNIKDELSGPDDFFDIYKIELITFINEVFLSDIIIKHDHYCMKITRHLILQEYEKLKKTVRQNMTSDEAKMFNFWFTYKRDDKNYQRYFIDLSKVYSFIVFDPIDKELSHTLLELLFSIKNDTLLTIFIVEFIEWIPIKYYRLLIRNLTTKKHKVYLLFVFIQYLMNFDKINQIILLFSDIIDLQPGYEMQLECINRILKCLKNDKRAQITFIKYLPFDLKIKNQNIKLIREVSRSDIKIVSGDVVCKVGILHKHIHNTFTTSLRIINPGHHFIEYLNVDIDKHNFIWPVFSSEESIKCSLKYDKMNYALNKSRSLFVKQIKTRYDVNQTEFKFNFLKSNSFIVLDYKITNHATIYTIEYDNMLYIKDKKEITIVKSNRTFTITKPNYIKSFIILKEITTIKNTTDGFDTYYEEIKIST